MVSDQPETLLVSELLREKLLVIARDELPHSIVVTAEALEELQSRRADPRSDGDDREAEPVLRFRAVVRVERDSQKGIVIGKGGSVIRDAGTAARLELEKLLGARVYLETSVKVDPHWQRRAHSLDRLGL
jgi:GTP-binding protein Era